MNAAGEIHTCQGTDLKGELSIEDYLPWILGPIAYLGRNETFPA
jgi:hypothetical protein